MVAVNEEEAESKAPDLRKVLLAMERSQHRLDQYFRWLQDWRNRSERKDVWYD